MPTKGPPPGGIHDFTALHDPLGPPPGESRVTPPGGNSPDEEVSSGQGPELSGGSSAHPPAESAVEENESSPNEWRGNLDPGSEARSGQRPEIPSTFVGPGVWILPRRPPGLPATASPAGTLQNQPSYIESDNRPGTDPTGVSDPAVNGGTGARTRIPLDFVGPGVWSLPTRRPPPRAPGDPPATIPST